MPLVRCPDCGFNVSNLNGACPSCGLAFEGRMRSSAWAAPNPLWNNSKPPESQEIDTPAYTPSAEPGEVAPKPTPAIPPKPVAACASCDSVSTKAGGFCATCGSEMQSISVETEVEHLQAVVESLQAELAVLRQAVDADTKHGQQPAPPPEFTWAGVRPPERWTVAWGVWWRLTIAFILLQIVLYFVLLAVIGVLTSPN